MDTLKLNQTQLAFCNAPAGNIRLLAPAGCGKTHSLLYRCSALVQQSRRGAVRILFVTFTRAARDEIRTRINELSEFSNLRNVTDVATLNSWGFRRVKAAASYPKLITAKDQYHFTVLNQLQAVWQQHPAVKAAIERNRNTTPRRLMDAIDDLKALGFDHLRHKSYDDFSAYIDQLTSQNLDWRLKEIADHLTALGVLEAKTLSTGEEVATTSRRILYDAFFKFWGEATAALKSSATFTLEDQKYFAYLDEQQKVEERNYLSGAARYSHIVVDEFQDINPLDLKLIGAIASRNRATITIAGDDDQAIFEWRGSTPEYILMPEKYLGGAFQTHTLGVNYRSPSNVVDRSQRLISHNQRRVEKDVAAANAESARIEIVPMDSLEKSMDFVYKIVESAIKEGTSPAKVAIIGRKRCQLIPYQVHFASRDISFCAAEDLQLFLSEAFDRLMELMEFRADNRPRTRPTQATEILLKLCDLVRRYPLSKKDKGNVRLHVQSSNPTSLRAACSALMTYRGEIKGPNTNGKTSISMAEAIAQFLNSETVEGALFALGANFAGLQLDLGKAEDDIFYIDPPFLQLAEYAERYNDDFEGFLNDIQKAKESLVFVPPFEGEESEAQATQLWQHPVHLMTALRAKGKEFDTAILLDVNDGIWPDHHAKSVPQLEAERRVFYVAFTRARKNVFLLVRERLGPRPAVPSPYVEELGL